MPFGIKYSTTPPKIHVIAGLSRNIRVLRQPGFVNAFCGFDDFVKPRGDFWRRNTTTKNVTSWNGRTVELAISVLALNEYGTLQRQPGKET